MERLQNHPHYEEASRHARRLRGFCTHALVYLLVNAGLALVNLTMTPGRWWFGWTTFGWGIGLLAHALSVFAFGGLRGRDWEERRIREYLERRS